MPDLEPVSRWLLLVLNLPARPSRHREQAICEGNCAERVFAAPHQIPEAER